MLVASVYYKKVYANIRQVVKKYYKIKIDYRDLQSGFYEFLQCPTPCFYSIGASLHSNGSKRIRDASIYTSKKYRSSFYS